MEGLRLNTGYGPVAKQIYQTALEAEWESRGSKILYLFADPEHPTSFQLPQVSDENTFSKITGAYAVINNPVVDTVIITQEEPTDEEMETFFQGNTLFSAVRIKPLVNSMSFHVIWDRKSVDRLGLKWPEQYKKINDIKKSLEGIMGEPVLDNSTITIFQRRGCEVHYCPLVPDFVSVSGSNRKRIQEVIETVDLHPTRIYLKWSKI